MEKIQASGFKISRNVIVLSSPPSPEVHLRPARTLNEGKRYVCIDFLIRCYVLPATLDEISHVGPGEREVLVYSTHLWARPVVGCC